MIQSLSGPGVMPPHGLHFVIHCKGYMKQSCPAFIVSGSELGLVLRLRASFRLCLAPHAAKRFETLSHSVCATIIVLLVPS